MVQHNAKLSRDRGVNVGLGRLCRAWCIVIAGIVRCGLSTDSRGDAGAGWSRLAAAAVKTGFADVFGSRCLGGRPVDSGARVDRVDTSGNLSGSGHLVRRWRCGGCSDLTGVRVYLRLNRHKDNKWLYS